MLIAFSRQIKNWTQIKKKRTEKGLRKNSPESKPHSKEDIFSRFLIIVMFKILPIKRNKRESKKEIKIKIIKIIKKKFLSRI